MKRAERVAQCDRDVGWTDLLTSCWTRQSYKCLGRVEIAQHGIRLDLNFGKKVMIVPVPTPCSALGTALVLSAISMV